MFLFHIEITTLKEAQPQEKIRLLPVKGSQLFQVLSGSLCYISGESLQVS